MSLGDGGPLSIEDLAAIWAGATDESYSAPFLEAGDGEGREVQSQAWAQFARVSQAIDTTTQALYILPWSGQTAPPAAGEARATVALSFTRTARIETALRLTAGAVFVEEVATDWGDEGGVDVPTGRRYTLVADLVLMPGEAGPVTALAVAEGPGYGYNNPRPGTLRRIVQPGVGFNHDKASVVITSVGDPNLPNHRVLLQTINQADTIVPEHVGQHVEMTAGVNAGLLARVAAFAPPDLTATPPRGSTATLDVVIVLTCWSPAPGELFGFVPGERLTVYFDTLYNVLGEATFLRERLREGDGDVDVAFTMVASPGDNFPGFVDLSIGNVHLRGAQSGADANSRAVVYAPVFDPEIYAPLVAAPGASWRVVDWASDLGLQVTNAESPTGGRLAMLDALGAERGLPRLDGEEDDAYRQRIHRVADVVTPNALRRAAVRTLEGLPFCFREVGSANLPGFYYDRGDAGGDFYDDEVLSLKGSIVAGTSFFIDPAVPGGFQERVVYRGADGRVKATGFFGKFSIGTDAARVTIIRRTGQGTLALPVVVEPGDEVIGLSSGARFGVVGSVDVPEAVARRFHTYLDYEQMRAFFLMGVPPLAAGEFGFAYDDSGANAYDARGPSVFNFFDGFAAEAALMYRRLYDQLSKVKAGGVSFEIYLEHGSCP